MNLVKAIAIFGVTFVSLAIAWFVPVSAWALGFFTYAAIAAIKEAK